MKRPDLSHSTDCDDNERLEQYQSAWPTWPLELCIRFGALSLKVSVGFIPMYLTNIHGRWKEVVATVC